MRQNVLSEQKRSSEVDRENAIPIVDSSVGHGSSEAYPGRIDSCVQAAKLGRRRRDRGSDSAFITHICVDGNVKIGAPQPRMIEVDSRNAVAV
jgi:hypothetical protein